MQKHFYVTNSFSALNSEVISMPLIIPCESEKWTDVRKVMTNRKINYTKAKPAKESIKIISQDSIDFRELTNSLEERQIK